MQESRSVLGHRRPGPECRRGTLAPTARRFAEQSEANQRGGSAGHAPAPITRPPGDLRGRGAGRHSRDKVPTEPGGSASAMRVLLAVLVAAAVAVVAAVDHVALAMQADEAGNFEEAIRHFSDYVSANAVGMVGSRIGAQIHGGGGRKPQPSWPVGAAVTSPRARPRMPGAQAAHSRIGSARRDARRPTSILTTPRGTTTSVRLTTAAGFRIAPIRALLHGRRRARQQRLAQWVAHRCHPAHRRRRHDALRNRDDDGAPPRPGQAAVHRGGGTLPQGPHPGPFQLHGRR